VRFYDAERVLSAIGKFLVYLLVEVERQGRKEGKDRGKSREEKGERRQKREGGVRERYR